jgi:hypothetical protein
MSTSRVEILSETSEKERRVRKASGKTILVFPSCKDEKPMEIDGKLKVQEKRGVMKSTLLS